MSAYSIPMPRVEVIETLVAVALRKDEDPAAAAHYASRAEWSTGAERRLGMSLAIDHIRDERDGLVTERDRLDRMIAGAGGNDPSELQRMWSVPSPPDVSPA